MNILAGNALELFQSSIRILVETFKLKCVFCSLFQSLLLTSRTVLRVDAGYKIKSFSAQKLARNGLDTFWEKT